MSPYTLKMGVIAVPDGVKGANGRVILCFSPRVYATTSAATGGVLSYGEKTLKSIQLLLQEVSESDRRLKHLLVVTTDSSAAIPLTLSRDWRRMWRNAPYRSEIWKTLAPQSMLAKPWDPPPPNDKYKAPPPNNSKEPVQLSRSARTPVESLTVAALEKQVRNHYIEIIRQTLEENDQASQLRALKVFADACTGYEFALDRLKDFGGMQAKAADEPAVAIAAGQSRRDEFHELITHLEEYANFSSYLGLIVETELPLNKLKQGTFALALQLRIPENDPNAAELLELWETGKERPEQSLASQVRYDLSLERWAQFALAYPAEHSRPEAPGFRLLSESDFKLIEIDAIGVGLHSLKYARRGYSPDSRVPVLRSAGFSLVKKDGAVEGIASSLNSVLPKTLDGDALTRGFVVDVGVKTTARKLVWESICARTGTITVKSKMLPDEPGFLFWKDSGRAPQISRFTHDAEVEEIVGRDHAPEETAVVTIPAEAPQPVIGVLIHWDEANKEAVLATSLGDVRVILPKDKKLIAEVGREYSFVGLLTGEKGGVANSPRDIELELRDVSVRGNGAWGSVKNISFPDGDKMRLDSDKARTALLNFGTNTKALTFGNIERELAGIVDGEQAVATGRLEFTAIKLVTQYLPRIAKIEDVKKNVDGSFSVTLADQIGQVTLTLSEAIIDGAKVSAGLLHLDSFAMVGLKSDGSLESVTLLGVSARVRVQSAKPELIVVIDNIPYKIFDSASIELRLALSTSVDTQEAEAVPDIVLGEMAAIQDALRPGDTLDALGYRNGPTVTIVSLRQSARGAFQLVRVIAASEDEENLIIADPYGATRRKVEFTYSANEGSGGLLVPHLGNMAWVMISKSGKERITAFRPQANDQRVFWGRFVQVSQRSWWLATPEGLIGLRDNTNDLQRGAVGQVKLDAKGLPRLIEAQVIGAVHGVSGADFEISPLDNGKTFVAAISPAPIAGEVVLSFLTRENKAQAARLTLFGAVETVKQTEGDGGFVDLTLLGYRVDDGRRRIGPIAFEPEQTAGGASRRLRLNATQIHQLVGAMEREGEPNPAKSVIEFSASEFLYVEKQTDLVVRSPGSFTGQWLDNGENRMLRAFLIGPNQEKIAFDLYVPKSTPTQLKASHFTDYRIGESVTQGALREENTWRVDEASRQVFVSQNIFTWTGESLGTTSPYEAPPDDQSAENPEAKKAQAKAAAERRTFLAQAHTPAGSMFPLLFGKRYYFRLRAMNIAGRTPPLNATQNESNGTAICSVYHRYDPISAPKIALARSLQSAVIPAENRVCSDDAVKAQPTAHYLRSFWNEKLKRYDLAREELIFFVLPGPAVYETVRAHGLLFPRLGPMKNADEIHEYLARIDRDSGGNFDYHRASGQLSYMPDPLARIAVIEVVICPAHPKGHKSPDGVFRIPFRGRWPSTKAVRVRCHAVLATTTRTRLSGNDLHIYLEPGETVTVRIACAPREEDYHLLGPRDIIAADTKALQEFDRSVANGSNRFVAAYSEIMVAHAVDRPVSMPVITQIELSGKSRAAGDTFLKPICAVQIHPASTGKVSIEATWNEYVDDSREILPRMPLQEARHYFDPLFEDMPESEMEKLLNLIEVWRAQPDESRPLLYPFLTQELPTFIERLDLRPATMLEVLDHFAKCAPLRRVVREADIERAQPGYPLLEERRIDFTQDLPEQKRVDIRYHAVATTAFTHVYRPPDDGGMKRLPKPLPRAEGDQMTPFIAVATMPPARLEIAKMLPLYGWGDDQPYSGNPMTRVRKANAVRVYFRRGWFSSGPGEKVAVLFENNAAKMSEGNRDRYATRRGFDPVWVQVGDQQAAMDVMKAEDCLLAVERMNVAAFASAPKRREGETPIPAIAAIHEVRYSPLKGLWYCDIAFTEPTSYMPFVRLALARYQKHAVDLYQLSDVVIAPFIQLHPERKLIIDACGSLTLSGSFAPEGGDHRPRPAITVTFEPRRWEQSDFMREVTASPDGSIRQTMDWDSSRNVFTTSLSALNKQEHGSILVTEEALYPAQIQNGSGLECQRALIYADRIHVQP